MLYSICFLAPVLGPPASPSVLLIGLRRRCDGGSFFKNGVNSRSREISESDVNLCNVKLRAVVCIHAIMERREFRQLRNGVNSRNCEMA